jgi:N-acetylglucosamine-6-phosphate deacetylase
MIRNMVHDAGMSLNDAVRMATLTPAEFQGIDHRKGSLEAAKDGDICIIDPDFNVHKTMRPEGKTSKRSR